MDSVHRGLLIGMRERFSRAANGSTGPWRGGMRVADGADLDAEQFELGAHVGAGERGLLGAEDAKVQFDDGNWLVLSDPRLEQLGSVQVLVGDLDGSSWHVPCSEVRRLATRRTEFWPVVANTVVVTVCVATVVAVSICAGQVPDVFSGLRFDGPSGGDDIGTSRAPDCAEKGRAEGAFIP